MPKVKKDKTYCIVSNMCTNHKYLCCNFCTSKTCIYRCKDNPKGCKYLTDIDSGIPQTLPPSQTLDEAAIKTRKSKATKEKEWLQENVKK